MADVADVHPHCGREAKFHRVRRNTSGACTRVDKRARSKQRTAVKSATMMIGMVALITAALTLTLSRRERAPAHFLPPSALPLPPYLWLCW